MGNFFKNIHPLLRKHRKPEYEEDTNYAVLNSISVVLEDLEESTLALRAEIMLEKSSKKHLDYYGEWFGVPRKDNERDKDYRKRIIEAINIPRGTNSAIKHAIRRYLEDNTIGIEIYEPWKDIFYLSNPSSRLSGLHKLQGTYYHFAVIDVHIGSPFGKEIVNIINDFKPAGVTLHTTYDSSIANITVTAKDGWGAIPYTDLGVTQEILNIQHTPSKKLYTQGQVLLSDVKFRKNIFNLNESLIGGLDVLSGSYGVHNNLLHLAGIGSDFTPNDNTLMEDVRLAIEPFPDEFYFNRDNRSREYFKARVRPSRYLYLAFNIDTLLQTKNPEFNRVNGDYEKAFKNTSFQLSGVGDRGKVVYLEAFNFSRSNWETLSKKTGETTDIVLKGKYREINKYMSKNKLLFLRLNTKSEDITFKFNHFQMSYRGEVGSSKLGYSIKPYMAQKPLVEREQDTNGVTFYSKWNELDSETEWEDLGDTTWEDFST